MLVSSHEYIRGIEKADSAAKSVLDLPCVKDDVTYISQYIISTWLDDCEQASFRHKWSWEIGCPLTRDARRMKLLYVVNTLVTHLAHLSTVEDHIDLPNGFSGSATDTS